MDSPDRLDTPPAIPVGQAPPVRSLLDFTGKVVLVTGAGSGIGQGIALRFAEAGAWVMVHYHSSADGAREAVERIIAAGGEAAAHGGDLTQPDATAELVRATVARFGRIDVLVNNVGKYPMVGVLHMDPAQWDDVLAANLRSVFLMTQAVARQMIVQEMVARGEGGAIVNISSIEAHNPAPGHSHYNAAKGGVLMYTRAAANELGPHGIRVNAVAPGLIRTSELDTTWPEGIVRYLRAAPLGRIGTPDDVADACLFLASPAARWITGASLTVDGGVLTHQAY